jgi:hypothetical protein
MKNIKPRDVVLLGLCSQSQFNDVISQVKSGGGAAEENPTKKKKAPAKAPKIKTPKAKK